MAKKQRQPADGIADDLFDASFPVIRDEYLDQLANMLETGNADWSRFQTLMQRALILSGLIGTASVFDELRDDGEDIATANDEPLGDVVSKYQDAPPDAFDLPPGVEFLSSDSDFQQAIDMFRDRIPSLRSTVERIGDAARERAFFVTGIEQTDALETLRDRLTEIAAGRDPEDTGRIPDFAEMLREEAGVELADARIETVYRNNVMTALNEARATTSRERGDAVPLMELVEIKDRRTRGNSNGLYPDRGFHWQMDGFVEPTHDPIWLKITPPNGHNCRGRVVGVTRRKAKRNGWVREDGSIDQDAIDRHNGERLAILRRGDYPDRGWTS